jgi:hypothetical protein
MAQENASSCTHHNEEIIPQSHHNGHNNLNDILQYLDIDTNPKEIAIKSGLDKNKQIHPLNKHLKYCEGKCCFLKAIPIPNTLTAFLFLVLLHPNHPDTS